MSILSRIRTLSPRGKIVVGVAGGLLVGLFALFVINMLFWGLPMNPGVYQYEYPNGTSATTPISETSVNIHGTGVALSNNAYEVTYSERTIHDSGDGDEVVSESRIYYQINNAEAIGYLERSNIGMGVVNQSEAPTLHIYENRSNAYIHNVETNNTTIQNTKDEPLVLTNQIELPQKLLRAVPHVSWKAVGMEEDGKNTYIVYTATDANANQISGMNTVDDVTGTLKVNKRTNVITYTVTVSGRTTDGTGASVDVTKKQSLTYTVLDNSTVPDRPTWAVGEPPASGNETDTTSGENESDDGWTPPGKISNDTLP